MNGVKRIFSVGAACLFGTMIVAYLAAIVYLNFSVTPGFYITDMYTDILVAMEMWQEKSLFPASWTFGNQLYVAATPVLAALIYGITGNAFRSMGAASCVMTVLVLASFMWMIWPAFRKTGPCLLATAAFMALVALFGDAVLVMNGWQLLFTMCSYYACYAISAFLTFGCYLRCENRVPVFLCAAACLLSFAMGIQSLRQTAVMVFPLIGMEALQMLWRLLHKLPVWSGATVFSASAAFANLAGLVLGKTIQVNQVQIIGEIRLSNPAQALKAVGESLRTFWSLFARDTSYPNEAYRTVLLVFLLISLVVFLLRLKEENRCVKLLMGSMFLSILAIFFADTLTTMNVRGIYYFMAYPMIAILGAWLYQLTWKRIPFMPVLTALMCLVFCMSWTREIYPACRQAYDRSLDSSYSVSEHLLEKGYTTVYSSWNFGERLAIASWGKLNAGFYTDPEDPFVPVKYLCNDSIFEAEATEAVYLFRTEQEAQKAIEKAAVKNIALLPVAEYPEAGMYLYTASENLLQIFE